MIELTIIEEDSSEQVLIIFGIIGWTPFLLRIESVGANSDFLKIDLKSNGPVLSSSLSY